MSHWIYWRNRLIDDPALWAAAKAACAEHRANWGDSFEANESDSAVYIMQSDGVASLIVYRDFPEKNALYIGMAWTRIDVQRRGYFGALVRSLEIRAHNLGRKHLLSCIDFRNEVSVAAHRACGIIPKVVMASKKLAD